MQGMQGATWSNECLHLKLNFQLYIQIVGHNAHQEEENIPPALGPSTNR